LLKILLISGIVLLFSATINFSYSQIAEFSQYENEEYGIELEYPSGWHVFGDAEAGDYVTDIAVFVPPTEINFKEYDSFKDYFKFGKRASILLDYSYVLPKLNLNFALDDTISAYSENIKNGFKKFEVIESNTNSKINDQPAYKLVYQFKYKGDYYKYLEFGTIINDNQLLSINFKAPMEEFDSLLPIFEKMIESFKFEKEF
jgi:hypothetical protein